MELMKIPVIIGKPAAGGKLCGTTDLKSGFPPRNTAGMTKIGLLQKIRRFIPLFFKQRDELLI